MAAERTSGMTARVAMAMAEGDRLDIGWGARAATDRELAQECGIAEPYVRSVKARIRKQLGPQATLLDMGWRGGNIWHPGRPKP